VDQHRVEVVVADRHPCTYRGLEAVLPRYGLRVTGSAGSLGEGIEVIAARRPDVALVDPELAPPPALVARLKSASPTTRILLLTGCPETGLLRAAARSGAAGLALKTIALAELGDALHTVARGQVFVDPAVRALLRPGGGRLRGITQRQAEILALLADGLAVKEIAAQLAVSQATVHKHVQSAITNLGARSRLHAVILAARRGEIELELAAPSGE
jgi:DNA-binding NarL/FixJ family response regulator